MEEDYQRTHQSIGIELVSAFKALAVLAVDSLAYGG